MKEIAKLEERKIAKQEKINKLKQEIKKIEKKNMLKIEKKFFKLFNKLNNDNKEKVLQSIKELESKQKK